MNIFQSLRRKAPVSVNGSTVEQVNEDKPPPDSSSTDSRHNRASIFKTISKLPTRLSASFSEKNNPWTEVKREQNRSYTTSSSYGSNGSDTLPRSQSTAAPVVSHFLVSPETSTSTKSFNLIINDIGYFLPQYSLSHPIPHQDLDGVLLYAIPRLLTTPEYISLLPCFEDPTAADIVRCAIASRVVRKIQQSLSHYGPTQYSKPTRPPGSPNTSQNRSQIEKTAIVHTAERIQELVQELLPEVVKKCAQKWKKYVHAASVSTGKPNTSSLQGIRLSNEDSFVLLPFLSELMGRKLKQPLSYYAVYDGHGGPECSSFISAHLHVIIARRLFQLLDKDPSPAPTAVRQMMADAFMETNNMFQTTSSYFDIPATCGSTAIVALVVDKTLYLAWAGDSSAILFMKGGVWLDFVVPHKPSFSSEKTRIEKLGGFIQNERVNGALAVSRSFGDTKYGCVLPEPDILDYTLTGNEHFLLLACDGLTDVMDPAAILNNVLSSSTSDPTIATKLAEEALVRGSTDNVTTIFIPLDRPWSLSSSVCLSRCISKQSSFDDLEGLARIPTDPQPIEPANTLSTCVETLADERVNTLESLVDAPVELEERVMLSREQRAHALEQVRLTDPSLPDSLSDESLLAIWQNTRPLVVEPPRQRMPSNIERLEILAETLKVFSTTIE